MCMCYCLFKYESTWFILVIKQIEAWTSIRQFYTMCYFTGISTMCTYLHWENIIRLYYYYYTTKMKPLTRKNSNQIWTFDSTALILFYLVFSFVNFFSFLARILWNARAEVGRLVVRYRCDIFQKWRLNSLRPCHLASFCSDGSRRSLLCSTPQLISLGSIQQI